MVDKNINYNVFDIYLIKNVKVIEIEKARYKTTIRLQISTLLQTTIGKRYNMLSGYNSRRHSGRPLVRRSECHLKRYLVRQSRRYLKRHSDAIL